MLKEGIKYRSELTVGEGDTAMVVGSGDMAVLATPRMMALMENAAMMAVAGELNEGDTTVGGHIESSHLAPSAVGATVVAEATLTKVDGRKLYFDIEARQVTAEDEKLIGKGTHLRFVVNKAKFMSKIFH